MFFNPKHIIIKVIAIIVCACFLWQDVVWAAGSDFTVRRSHLRQRQFLEQLEQPAGFKPEVSARAGGDDDDVAKEPAGTWTDALPDLLNRPIEGPFVNIIVKIAEITGKIIIWATIVTAVEGILFFGTTLSLRLFIPVSLGLWGSVIVVSVIWKRFKKAKAESQKLRLVEGVELMQAADEKPHLRLLPREDDDLPPSEAGAAGEPFPAAEESGFKTVFFDIGNVIFRCDYHTASEKLTEYCDISELEIYGVLTSMSDDGLMWPFESGQMTKYGTEPDQQGRQYFEELSARIGLKDITYEQFIGIFCNIYAEIPGTVDLMMELKKMGYKVYILSNTNALHKRHLISAYPHLSETIDNDPRNYIASNEAGMMKPGVDIYNEALEVAGLIDEPQRAIFIDDVPAYLHAAHERGIGTVRMTSLDMDLRQALMDVLRPAGTTAAGAAGNASGLSTKIKNLINQEGFFKAALIAYIGFFGYKGSMIFASPESAKNIFGQSGWILAVIFALAYSASFSFMTSAKKGLRSVAPKLLYAPLIPLSGYGLAVTLASDSVLSRLGVLFKGHITPVNTVIAAAVIIFTNILLVISKYLRREGIAAFKNDYNAFKNNISRAAISIPHIAYFNIVRVTAYLNSIFSSILWGWLPILSSINPGDLLGRFLTSVDGLYKHEQLGLGLAVVTAFLIFILGNVKAYQMEIADQSRQAQPYDYRRAFIIGYFFTFGAIFFSRLMEFYSRVLPKDSITALAAPVAYEGLFFTLAFLAGIALEVIKEALVRDKIKNPQWLVYASARYGLKLHKAVGIGNTLMLGLMYYSSIAIYILNSNFSGGFKMLIFNVADFIWAIIFSRFLQKATAGDSDTPAKPGIDATPASSDGTATAGAAGDFTGRASANSRGASPIHFVSLDSLYNRVKGAVRVAIERGRQMVFVLDLDKTLSKDSKSPIDEETADLFIGILRQGVFVIVSTTRDIGEIERRILDPINKRLGIRSYSQLCEVFPNIVLLPYAGIQQLPARAHKPTLENLERSFSIAKMCLTQAHLPRLEGPNPFNVGIDVEGVLDTAGNLWSIEALALMKKYKAESVNELFGLLPDEQKSGIRKIKAAENDYDMDKNYLIINPGDMVKVALYRTVLTEENRGFNDSFAENLENFGLNAVTGGRATVNIMLHVKGPAVFNVIDKRIYAYGREATLFAADDEWKRGRVGWELLTRVAAQPNAISVAVAGKDAFVTRNDRFGIPYGAVMVDSDGPDTVKAMLRGCLDSMLNPFYLVKKEQPVTSTALTIERLRTLQSFIDARTAIRSRRALTEDEEILREADWLLGWMIQQRNCSEPVYYRNVPLHLKQIRDLVQRLKKGNASAPVLLAAMFHEANRLYDGCYVSLQNQPARDSDEYGRYFLAIQQPAAAADFVTPLLKGLQIDSAVVSRADVLIRNQISGIPGDAESQLLRDARTLLFFMPRNLVQRYKIQKEQFRHVVSGMYISAGPTLQAEIDSLIEENREYFENSSASDAQERRAAGIILRRIQQSRATGSAAGRDAAMAEAIGGAGMLESARLGMVVDASLVSDGFRIKKAAETKTALIISENEIALKILEDMLRKIGFKIIIKARSQQEADSAFAQYRIDLVINRAGLTIPQLPPVSLVLEGRMMEKYMRGEIEKWL